MTICADAFAGGHPDGAALLRLSARTPGVALAPNASEDTLAGLVRLPFGVSAESVGLAPMVPGFGQDPRRGATAISSFSSAHPDLTVEVAPPLHMLLDQAGIWTGATVAHQDGANGDGVLIGVADTGLDVTHPDFFDANGNTRVAWILDLSAKPYGKYPELEQKYGVLDAAGNVTLGAVYQGSDFAALRAASIPLPGDEVGHGTHVTSLAAGNGGHGSFATPYIGVAPHASILFARITTDGDGQHRRRQPPQRRTVHLRPRRLHEEARRGEPLARERLRPSRRHDGLGAGDRRVRRPDDAGTRARRRGGQQRRHHERSRPPERPRDARLAP